MKINVGCGWEVREAWLNVDSTQKPQRINYPITFMDATKTWPHEDGVFDAVLSEHMIEHISDEDGTRFLQEAFRTLKFGGVIRISCPDREFFEQLHLSPHHVFVKNYARAVLNTNVPIFAIAPTIKRIVKRTLEEQGHVWVPTGQQLIDKLMSVGFHNVNRSEFGKSAYDVFDGIEVKNGVREYESVCVEAIK